MQTPLIFNSGNVNQGAKAPAKQADNSESGSSFGQVLSNQIAEKRPASSQNQTRETGKANETGKPREPDKPEASAKPAEASKSAEAGKTTDGTTASAEAGEGTDKQTAESMAVDPAIAQMLALAANGMAGTQEKPAMAEAETLPPTIAATEAIVSSEAANGLLPPAIVAGEVSGRLKGKGLAGDKPESGKTDVDFKTALTEAKEPSKQGEEKTSFLQEKGGGLQTALNAAQNTSGTAQEKLGTLAANKFQEAVPTITAATAMQQAGFEPAQAATGRPTTHLAPHVGTPGWDQALGQKVVWMVSGAQQSASLTLNPPDLGPLQVVLNVSNGQADASFYAAQPEVRQALEAAMPKLRDMMSDAGVQLGQTTVSAGMPDQHNQPGERQAGHGSGGNGGSTDADAITPTVRQTAVSGGIGLVDTFA